MKCLVAGLSILLATTGTVLGADTVECTQIAARLVALLGGGRLGLCAAADSSSGFSQLSPNEEVVETDFKMILPKVETISEVSECQPLLDWADNHQGIHYGHTFCADLLDRIYGFSVFLILLCQLFILILFLGIGTQIGKKQYVIGGKICFCYWY